MKLLLDQNISSWLVAALQKLYPDILHVRDHGLAQADDEAVWEFAKQRNLIIVSKDADFHQRSFLYGFPPKVIWLKKGNCATGELEQLLKTQLKTIESFWSDPEVAFLMLS